MWAASHVGRARGVTAHAQVTPWLPAPPVDIEERAWSTELRLPTDLHGVVYPRLNRARVKAVVVVMAAARPQAPPVDDMQAELLKKFGGLSLAKKMATLAQFEVITMSEAFDTAIEKPLAFGSKTFDKFMNRKRPNQTKEQAQEENR